MIHIWETPNLIDSNIVKTLNSFHNSFLDIVMVFISNIGEYAIIWLIIGLFLLMLDKKNGKFMFSTLIIALIIEVAINDGILKNIFYRERPYLLFSELHHLGPDTMNSSFVSGHTASSIAIFLVLIKFYKKMFYPFAFLVLLMIWTRFYLGMHYPSDILGGVAVGTLSAWLAFSISKKFAKIK
jgi:undecaprenyl-diphosphatase